MVDPISAAIFAGLTIWFNAFTIKWVAETVSGTPTRPPWWWSWTSRSDFRFRWFWTLFGLVMLGLFEFTVIVQGQTALETGHYVAAGIWGAQLVFLAYGITSTVRAYR